jgi:hypothetical protein
VGSLITQNSLVLTVPDFEQQPLNFDGPATPAQVHRNRRKAASERAQIGIARAASRAVRIDPAWIGLAIDELRKLARDRTKPFTIDELRPQLPAVPEGVDARVWGHVTREAKRLGVIVPDGGVARSPSSNGSLKETYLPGPG